MFYTKAYAGFLATGVWAQATRCKIMKLDKNSPKQADFIVFASNPRGACIPFAHPWIYTSAVGQKW